jgi:hypothetical protein
VTLKDQIALSDAVTAAVLKACRPAYEATGGTDPDFWKALRHGLDDARLLLVADAGAAGERADRRAGR